MLEDWLDNFESGWMNVEDTLEIVQRKTGYDAEQLPVTNVVNLAVLCFDDFEGTRIPPQWQSPYNASFALLELSLSIVNFITCNQHYACI